MELRYEIQGAGPTIIMVHGLGGSSNSFQPQAQYLATRFRVVRPELPGAGRSASLPVESLEAVADALADLTRQLAVDSAHWVGHSLGTVLCQIIAVRHSARVKSLALLGPIAEAAAPARGALHDRAKRVRAEGLDWFVDNYIAGSLSVATQRDNPAVGAFLRESLLRQASAQYADFCLALAQHTAVTLPSIAAPTLLMTGDEDRVGTVTTVGEMARQLPNAELHVLKSCGHWLTVERPTDVTMALEAHFASVGTPVQ